MSKTATALTPKTATALTAAAPENTTEIISPIEGRGPSSIEKDEDQAIIYEAMAMTNDGFGTIDANGDDVITKQEITDEADKKEHENNINRDEIHDWAVLTFDKMEAHIGRMDGQITKDEMNQAAYELLKSGEICYFDCKWSWMVEDD